VLVTTHLLREPKTFQGDKLAYLAARTFGSRVLKRGGSHSSLIQTVSRFTSLYFALDTYFYQARANRVDSDIGEPELVRSGLSKRVYAGRKTSVI
jgi:hypothetical protein